MANETTNLHLTWSGTDLVGTLVVSDSCPPIEADIVVGRTTDLGSSITTSDSDAGVLNSGPGIATLDFEQEAARVTPRFIDREALVNPCRCRMSVEPTHPPGVDPRFVKRSGARNKNRVVPWRHPCHHVSGRLGELVHAHYCWCYRGDPAVKMVQAKAEVKEVRGERPGSELDMRIDCRCAPVVQVVSREAADELFQFVAGHYGNFRLGGNVERIETRCNLASQGCYPWITVNLAFDGSNHIPESFGVWYCTAEACVCILNDFMECEVGAYVPEASVPGGSVAEELAEPS